MANEIGFGQTTAIRRYAGQGVELVGSLPREIAKITTYEAGRLSAARAHEPAQAFIEFLATPVARGILVATGVE